ncbi:hypothetical protein NQ317_000596 [Molorchus minor]|uniref:LITAF domain-containing protein n=1 Tax=Molorchus minor TaxID=1323400 RepID=A0ABQ9J169_9CUCU|nr:hypothetical protein NQ317_000596 [Molorchus minor]
MDGKGMPLPAGYPGSPSVVHVMATPPLVLGPLPASLTCPSCHAQITTNVESESNTRTHLFALILCLVFFPCVCVPYCIDSCKNQNHYCPHCHAFIGRHEN